MRCSALRARSLRKAIVLLVVHHPKAIAKVTSIPRLGHDAPHTTFNVAISMR